MGERKLGEKMVVKASLLGILRADGGPPVGGSFLGTFEKFQLIKNTKIHCLGIKRNSDFPYIKVTGCLLSSKGPR